MLMYWKMQMLKVNGGICSSCSDRVLLVGEPRGGRPPDIAEIPNALERRARPRTLVPAARVPLAVPA